ncbi:MAG: hypothetical protein AAF599_10405, partial [Bacteroidota bacterium]
MKSTTLYHLLHNFSIQELQQFQEYVHSPFFNKNEKVKMLCNCLMEKGLEIDKEQLYLSVFKNSDYQELRLNNVISDLLQLAYGYLVFKQTKEHPLQQQAHLLESLIERNVQRPIYRAIQKGTRIQQNIEAESYQFLQEKCNYLEQLDRFALTQNQREYDENLQKMSDTLDAYYLCNKFRIACEMVSRSAMLNEQYEPNFMNATLKEYEQNQAQYTSFPALKIYHQAYQFLSQTSADGYRELKVLLQQFPSTLSRPELRHLYTYMLNFGVRQINFGRSEYYRETLQIYQTLIEKNLLLQHGYLTKWSFINATTTGMRLEEYEWTEKFIKDYQDALRVEERKNTVDYQLAALYFAKADFSKTLQFLQQVEFTNTFYQASARIIQLKVFYELEEIEPFYALVKSIRNLLRRKRKLSEYHRLSYLNFVRIAKRLLDLKLKPLYQIRERHLKFKEELENAQPMANKEWLWRKYEMVTQ